jgi:hypothetical protein
MVDKNTTTLTAAAALTGSELAPITQSGNSRKATTQAIANLASIPFTQLSDAPSVYTTFGLYGLRVTAAEDGVEFYLPSFIGLDDVPATYTGQAAKIVRVNATEDGLEFATAPSGTLPSTTAGDAGKPVVVNATEDGYELGEFPTFVVVADKTADYTLVLTDAGAYIRMDDTVDIDLTVPANATVAFVIGTVIQLRQVGVGQLIVVASGGVTINTVSTLFARAQGSTLSLTKVGTDEWDLTGDLEAL